VVHDERGLMIATIPAGSSAVMRDPSPICGEGGGYFRGVYAASPVPPPAELSGLTIEFFLRVLCSAKSAVV